MALSLDGRLVIGSDYSPSFYRGLTHILMADMARQPLPRTRLRISETVYLPWLWKYHEYGHFLVEMLPRVLLLKELYARGLKFPVLVPAASDLLHEALETFAPELVVLPVDDRGTEIHLKHCLIPVDGSLEHAFHPDRAERINAAVAEIRGVSRRTQSPRRGIFLSRIEFRAAKGRDFRLLANESQLHGVAREAGLEIVEPQMLPLRDQALLMSNSALIVGEASSALHNVIFASGARVISLGWINDVQTMIAGLQSHVLSYLLPKSGPLLVSSYEAIPLGELEGEQRFDIDPKIFERVLLAALQSVDG